MSLFGRRNKLAIGMITGIAADVDTKYVPGSGVGSTNAAVYRAKLRHATICKDNNQCGLMRTLSNVVDNPLYKPTDLVATVNSDNTVFVSFTPGYSGGRSISNYLYSVDGGLTFIAFSPAQTTNPVLISGFFYGNTYNIQLMAATSEFISLASEIISVTIPTIMQTNLIVNLDAGDSRSYSDANAIWKNLGTGSTTFDASSTNLPTFTYANNTGRYFTFNGTTQYVNFTRPVDASFSWGAWIRTDNADSSGAQWYSNYNRQIIGGDSTDMNANDYGISIGNGSIFFGTGSPDTTAQSTNTYNDDMWHYITVTRNKGTGSMKIYVDGIADGTATGTTNILNTTTTLCIGRDSTANASTYFSGKIAAVHAYNRVLSADEILYNYNVHKGRYGL